jgi:hypothetical protein
MTTKNFGWLIFFFYRKSGIRKIIKKVITINNNNNNNNIYKKKIFFFYFHKSSNVRVFLFFFFFFFFFSNLIPCFICTCEMDHNLLVFFYRSKGKDFRLGKLINISKYIKITFLIINFTDRQNKPQTIILKFFKFFPSH